MIYHFRLGYKVTHLVQCNYRFTLRMKNETFIGRISLAINLAKLAVVEKVKRSGAISTRIFVERTKRLPHAGIEPATFCLQDRRSATKPMRHGRLAFVLWQLSLDPFWCEHTMGAGISAIRDAKYVASLAQGQSVCLVNRRSLVRFQHEAPFFSSIL